MRSSAIAALLGWCVLGGTGCGDQIVVPNSPATLEVEGVALVTDSFGLSGQQIELRYTLADEEGDDQTLRVQICEAPDLTRCGAPFQGPGSDGVAYVNTAPLGAKVAHVFRWDVGCGRLSATGNLASVLDVEYIARIGVEGEELVDSAPFTLSSLGLTSLPLCMR